MLNRLIETDHLSSKDYTRYARQISIKNIGVKGQLRLKQARVICIGAGGLNTPALLYLTACGVGTVGIIDHDVIETSNLQRQIIYKSDKFGQKKVKIAYKHLKSINPLVNIKTYDKYLNRKNIKQIFYNYDIVIDGTDNFQSKQLISYYCHQLHKVHIYGAIEGFVGHISVFNYKNGPQYYTLNQNFTQINNQTCIEHGILNVLAGTIGITQASETIKIITGAGSTLNGYLLVFNILDFSSYKVKIKLNFTCSQLNINTDRNNISDRRETLGKILNRNNSKKYKLIDVRTFSEFELDKISYAINIPLQVLKTQKSINYMQHIISQGYDIIIYCNNNIRSYIASQILKSLKIQHLIMHDNNN